MTTIFRKVGLIAICPSPSERLLPPSSLHWCANVSGRERERERGRERVNVLAERERGRVNVK